MSAPRPSRAAAAVVPPPPLALYVHLPWCLRKCPYCDFNSHEAPHGVDEGRYLDALEADLERSLPDIWGRTVQSVFVGGGTPSLFSPAAIDRLLTSVRTRLRVAPGAEVTLEANPGAADRERFEGFAAAGVNRISIGVQSLSDPLLAAVGRVHDSAQAKDAIRAARDCFPRVNLDFMFAMPGQTLSDCRADIDAALSMEVDHLSFYQMTIEPGTAFGRRRPPMPDEDAAAAMQALVEQSLGDAGFERYEVSAYARRADWCRHNLNYWRFGDYVGIGAGAHGKLSLPDGIVRERRTRHPARYMAEAVGAGGAAVREAVTAADLPFEFMLNALRLRDGVETALFEASTGLPLAAIARQIEAAVQAGLMVTDPRRLCASELGWRFLSDLQALFLPDDGPEDAP